LKIGFHLVTTLQYQW